MKSFATKLIAGVAVIVGFGLADGRLKAASISREEAVAVAREGKTGDAIAALRELLAADPNDDLIAYDLAVILTWAKRNREATNAFEKAVGDEPPEYVLGPIIRAYRDQKRFAQAERWARSVQERNPTDASWVKLLGLVLADQGKTKEARALLEPLRRPVVSLAARTPRATLRRAANPACSRALSLA